MSALALRRRLFTVFAGALLCVAGAGCGRKPAVPEKAKAPPPPVSDVEVIGWMRLDPGPRPEPSLLKVKPPDLPQHYRSLYRVKPDRRVLYAIVEIDRLLGGSQPPAVTVRFEDGAWKVRLGSDEAGSLPEIPTWADARRLLREWAAQRRTRYAVRTDSAPIPELSALEQDLAQGTPDRTFSALNRVNALAKRHPYNPELIAAAAKGAVWLFLQSIDFVRQSDPVAGHALALVALAQSLRPGSLTMEEAVLARQMGYEAFAEKCGEDLAPDDPVRLWLQFDSSGLAKAASAGGATPRTQYLMLLDRVRLGGREAFLSAFRRTVWAQQANTTSIGLTMLLGDFDLQRVAPKALTASAYLAVAREPVPSGSAPANAEAWPDAALAAVMAEASSTGAMPLEAHSGAFEKLVENRAVASDGPLFDRESIRAYYRAAFYSGVRATEGFLFEQYGSIASANDYARSIKNPAPGFASDQRDWMVARNGVADSSLRPGAAVAEIDRLTTLGVGDAALVLRDAMRPLGSGTDPLRRSAARIIARRADTRPSELYDAWNMANDLVDIRLAEAYSRSLVAQAPVTSGDMILRVAYWTRDAAWLRRIAVDQRHGTSNRTYALVDLGLMKDPDVAFRKAQYIQLMREQPEDGSPLDKCVTLLRDARDYGGADEVIVHWLESRPTRDHDLPWAHAVTLRADLLAEQKKWDAALKLIEPAAVTFKEECLLAMARYQEGLNRWDEAFATAKAAQERYNDAFSENIMARLYWRQHRPEDAAGLLAGSRNMTRGLWEGAIATSFADVFAESDPHDAQNAFTALIGRKVDPKSLAELAKAVGRRGNHDLALGLLKSLPSTGADQAAIQIWTYDEIEKAQGRDAAASWLRQSTTIPHQLALIAFQFQRYGILWDLLTDPERPGKDDEIQVLRAASLIHVPESDGKRRDALVDYFGGRPRNEFSTMGLFLVRKAGEADVFALAKNLGEIANVGWLMGLRDAEDGQYEQASDWFEVAVETGQVNTPPNAWSYEILRRWWEKARYLADLAREKVL
jgi:tetratricopeptide (TPR) repeat protein